MDGRRDRLRPQRRAPVLAGHSEAASSEYWRSRTERKGHSLMIIQSKTGELAQPAQKFSAREKNDAQRLFLIRKQIQRFDDTVVGGGRPGIKFLEKAPHGTWSRHIAFALTTGESRGNEAGDGIGRFRKTCVYRSAPASRLLPGYPAGFTPHTGQADIFHQTVVRPCAVRTIPFRFLSRKEQPQRRFFTAQRAQHPVKLLSVEHGDLLNIFASFFLRFRIFRQNRQARQSCERLERKALLQSCSELVRLRTFPYI